MATNSAHKHRVWNLLSPDERDAIIALKSAALPPLVNKIAPVPVEPATPDITTRENNEWLRPECLEDMARNLKACVASDCPQMLVELRQIYPSFTPKAACKLLTAAEQQQIKQ